MKLDFDYGAMYLPHSHTQLTFLSLLPQYRVISLSNSKTFVEITIFSTEHSNRKSDSECNFLLQRTPCTPYRIAKLNFC